MEMQIVKMARTRSKVKKGMEVARILRPILVKSLISDATIIDAYRGVGAVIMIMIVVIIQMRMIA